MFSDIANSSQKLLEAIASKRRKRPQAGHFKPAAVATRCHVVTPLGGKVTSAYVIGELTKKPEEEVTIVGNIVLSANPVAMSLMCNC